MGLKTILDGYYLQKNLIIEDKLIIVTNRDKNHNQTVICQSNTHVRIKMCFLRTVSKPLKTLQKEWAHMK